MILRKVTRFVVYAVMLVLVASVFVGISSRSNAQADSKFFPETGKTVTQPFLNYWNNHGGLAQQGYPITDSYDEKNDDDGKIYRTQYFERARFEYHPENAGTPNDVLLGEKKCAGILAQMEDDAVIAGIGINVGHATFPAEIAQLATSLRMAGASVSREELLGPLADSIDASCSVLKQRGDQSALPCRQAIVSQNSAHFLFRSCTEDAAAPLPCSPLGWPAASLHRAAWATAAQSLLACIVGFV